MASPHPARDPTERFSEGHSNPQIVAALKRLGFKTSTRSLERCLQRWGRRRPAGTPGVRIGGVIDELAEKVNYLFHHTTLNDDSIAARILSDYGLQTTGRQVRTFKQPKETFRAQGQAQYINFLDHITKPQGKGDWTLSTNHLDPKHPAPQLWCT